jgi:DNA primase
MSNQHQIQEIKERLPIEEVVSHYVKLEKSGINMKGVCPFHNEKTPSFFVAPHRGSFMCFGCGKKGDIFTFIQEIEGLEFFDALKKLADDAGIELEKSTQAIQENKNAYSLLERACLFFEKNLTQSQEATEYLKNRGLFDTTIQQFKIGYAPDAWHSLHDELKQYFSEKEIIESGLVIKNEKGNVYDRFRDRIMFPIFDSQGRVIAFTGRVLHSENKETPKYVNSPETSLFSKSHVLYGLNFAKQSIRKHNFIILVEGQMDVIMSHQMGYSNTVASSGTAFTEDQLQIIKKHTPHLVLAFDSDTAGLTTTAKVWGMAIAQNMDVKIAFYEEAKDPADTIKDNPDIWKNTIKQSIHIIEFVTRLVSRIQDERKRIKAYQEKILPLIKQVHTYSEKNFFINKVADMLSMNSAIIWSDVSIDHVEETFRQRTYIQPEKIQLEIILSTYITFFKKTHEELEEKIKSFFEQFVIKKIENDLIDDKKLFEIENEFEVDLESVKNQFKEYLSQYILNQLRIISKKLRLQLHSSPQDEHKILKQIEENKKLIHSIEKKDCQFINSVI